MKEGENDNTYTLSHLQSGRWSKLASKILHHPAYYITHLIVTILLVLLAMLELPSTHLINTQLAARQIYVSMIINRILHLILVMTSSLMEFIKT